MSDPFKYSTPQEEWINHDFEQRRRARSYRTVEIERDRESNGTRAAMSKWQVMPDQQIQAAITDYFEHKQTPDLQRRADGLQQSFEVAQVYAGIWLTVGPHLRLNTLTDQVELHGLPVNEKEVPLLLRNKAWEFGRLPAYDEVVVYASYNKYSPVEQYLSNLVSDDGD